MKKAFIPGFLVVALVLSFCYGCQQYPPGNPEITSKTRVDLVDWHISGLMIINCPVAWIRVTNYNSVPIKDVTFQYNTFDEEGHPLDQGTFTIDGTIPPGTAKNFIELYLGLVNLNSEHLSVKLLTAGAD